ncbi:hypothetical protein BH23CHL1_BH23CHL1_24530 [soil metagenome]
MPSGTEWEQAVGFSRVVRIGRFVSISGTAVTDNCWRHDRGGSRVSGLKRLEDEDVGRVGTALGEFWRRGELGVLAFEIGFADPTGLRAATSDIDRNVVLHSRADQVLKRRESERHQ